MNVDTHASKLLFDILKLTRHYLESTLSFTTLGLNFLVEL